MIEHGTIPERAEREGHNAPRFRMLLERCRSPVYAVVLALGCAAWCGLYRIRTFDTFFHLTAGRYILQHGRLPQTDPFSFSFPHARWLDHSAGFEVLIARVYEVSGFAGLSIYQALVSTALAAIALYALRGQRTLWPAAALLLAASMIAFREVLEARPHALGFLCLAALLVAALELHIRPRVRVVVAIAIVYALWVVVHGSHLVAYPVLAIGMLSPAPQLHRRRRLLHFASAFALVLLLGLTLAPQAFVQGPEHLGSEFLEASVREWYPVSLPELLEAWSGRVFLFCWLCSLLGAAAAYSEPDALAESLPSGRYPILLLLMFALFAFSSRRMLVLFLFGASPLWLPFSAYIWTRATGSIRSALGRTLAGVGYAIGWLACAAVLLVNTGTYQTGAGLAHNRFPQAAVDAIAHDSRIHHIYNAYNYGGYLMWRGVPKQGVFVDGRAITVYPDEFLRAFTAAYYSPPLFEKLVRRFTIDGVLMPVDSARTAHLRAYLRSSQAWDLTFHDAIAEVFEPHTVP